MEIIIELIGIGDLHLDKLDGIIVDVNTKIIKSIRRVFNYALENGVRNVIFYGDICDRTRLSYDAQKALYRLFLGSKYRDLQMHIILGNHDFDENRRHSLEVLECICDLTSTNLRVYTTMEEVKIDKRLFNMMPHPFTEFKRNALNVGHLELANSYRDNGRRVEHGLTTKHAGIGGHLHTCHKVRRYHYSGTLYQLNFGESLPKSFHHVKYEDTDPYNVEVTNVPFEPMWKLLNLNIESESDLDQIVDDPDILYKLFIKEGVDLDLGDVMAQHPNVIRHNKFKNKKELKELIEHEWDFETQTLDNSIDTRDVVADYLKTKHKLTDVEVARSFKLLNKITSQSV